MSSQRSGPALRLASAALICVISAYAPLSQAFFDAMNPNRWFGDDYDDDYDGPPPYGYGAPGYGPGYGPSLYGAPYAAPGYYGTPGYYGAPGYQGIPGGMPGAPPLPAAGTPTSADQAREIERLRRRIEALEANRPAAPPSSASPPASEDFPTGWPAAPAFRPLDGN